MLHFISSLKKNFTLTPISSVATVTQMPSIMMCETDDEIDSRPFWEGLPSLGADQEKRIEVIKEAHPIHDGNPDPYFLRRALYKAILTFRTSCNRQWVYDIKDVVKAPEQKVLS